MISIASDIDFIVEINNKKPTRRPEGKVSEYIQGRRYMPASTPFPGAWDNSRTPYLIELMDNMSPSSPIQHQAFMKPAQAGASASAENIIAYWMDVSPAEIMYISATTELLDKWVSKRLEPLIESCNIRDKIGVQVEIRGSRRTGDKVFTKQFIGGNLDMVSAQSPSNQRSDSKRILIRDEIDGSPIMLVTGEGNWLEVSLARTNAFSHRKKVYDLSTPTTFEASAIYQEYMDGDQRKFFVPCPHSHCGKFQILDWGSETSQHGIKADTTDGVLEKVYYICEYCHEAIFNHNKTEMLRRGEWRPTARSNSKYFRSYHMNALYVPVGMQSFFEIYERYLKALEDPDGMRAFKNLYLGWPYKEAGYRPPETIIELRGEYRAGVVPDDVIILTAGIDVQVGNKGDPDNPPRLEMEVCGHGLGYRTWSIDYKVFNGPIDNEDEGAWLELTNWARESGFGYPDKNGVFFDIKMLLIDSGAKTDVVYNFTSRWDSTYPSKGFGFLKKRKNEIERGDEVTQYNFRKYRRAKMAGDTILYEMSTNYYKNIIYANLNIKRADFPPQPSRLCSFPIDYGSNYFKQLRAEERRVDGSYHDFGRRNEALDCRVMNICAAQIFLDSWVQDLRDWIKREGGTKEQMELIRSDTILIQKPWEHIKR